LVVENASVPGQDTTGHKWAPDSQGVGGGSNDTTGTAGNRPVAGASVRHE
jgi:hypothetical protein